MRIGPLLLAAAVAGTAAWYFLPRGAAGPATEIRTIGGLTFSRIPKTTFLMGSPEGPVQHEVTVGAFWIAQQETPASTGTPVPRTRISYEMARAYCREFGTAHEVDARLPTEAEWECAARAGLRGAPYPWGWGSPEGRAVMDTSAPATSGSYPANAYGLFDMAGNVFEWCAATGTGDTAPARGGSWAERDPRFFTVWNRVDFAQDYRDADIGFRMVIEAGK